MNWNNSQSQRPTFTSTPLTTVLNFLWTNLPLVKHHVRILSLVFYLWKWLFYTYFSFNPLWNYHFILKKNKVPILPFYYYYLNPHFIRTILSLSFLALAPRNCDPHCNSHWISLSLSLVGFAIAMASESTKIRNPVEVFNPEHNGWNCGWVLTRTPMTSWSWGVGWCLSSVLFPRKWEFESDLFGALCYGLSTALVVVGKSQCCEIPVGCGELGPHVRGNIRIMVIWLNIHHFL